MAYGIVSRPGATIIQAFHLGVPTVPSSPVSLFLRKLIMVQFNTRANEILLKLVYYGPGLAGKTTNLQILQAMGQQESRGELFSINTQEDRTLFFDLFPIKLGAIYGNALHFQIYTVPGQVQYDASRRVVLSGADGVVFVADSSESKMQENVDSLSNLYHNLNANRLNIKEIPLIMQYNKRDCPDAMTVGVMNRRLNFKNVASFEAIATSGQAVLDTFVAIAKATVENTFKKYHLDKKIRDLNELLDFVDTTLRNSLHDLPKGVGDPLPTKENKQPLSVTTVPANVEPEQPVEPTIEAIDEQQNHAEIVRLYSEIKQIKHLLDKKNEETNALYLQLERANQDSLKTRRYLEGLLNGVGEGIISFSQDGRILTWNAAAEKMFGFQRSDIVGQSFSSLLPADRVAELEPILAQVAKGQILKNITLARLRKDGEALPVSITFAPIRGVDDRVLAYSAMVRDLDEQRALERKLEHVESNANLLRLMPMVFNEVANKLAVASAMKEGLLTEMPDPALQARLTNLFGVLAFAQNLIRPLLILAFPAVTQRTQISFNKLLQYVVKSLDGQANRNKVTVDIALDPTLPEGGLDESQMEQALTGLVRYCIHTSAASNVKRVRISTRFVNGTLQMVCQDTGPAIAQAENNSVFEASQITDGYSLGLCVAGSVVKAHGGILSVRSQEGVGNAFLLEMPVASGVVMNTNQDILQGKKVMVVDDEELLLDCLVDAMNGWGCAVTACIQGTVAIEKLQAQSFDLIVSDIRMPGLSGIELFDWIRTHQSTMTKRIIYTTGDSFDPDTREFLEKAQVPHLSKPFDLKRLREALIKLL